MGVMRWVEPPRENQDSILAVSGEKRSFEGRDRVRAPGDPIEDGGSGLREVITLAGTEDIGCEGALVGRHVGIMFLRLSGRFRSCEFVVRDAKEIQL